jgi:hypothetical protein
VKLALGAAIGLASLVAALGAQGAAPRGFDPQWVAAVSASEFWVGSKSVVLHTSDGGRHFNRLPAPPAATQVTFADSRNGFAFGWRTGLEATHDGGKSWHRVDLRSVLAFAVGGGAAYAVTGSCAQNGTCRDVRLERSPAAHDAWVSSTIPFPNAVSNFDLAARGRRVWLFGGSSAGRYELKNLLARSTNRGQTFVTDPAPCEADLAAELEPSPDGTLWAFCPTGMMGGAWRSANGGRTFRALPIPGCCINGAQLAPSSVDVAVLAPNVDSRPPLLRTTNAGKTWKPARAPGSAIGCLSIKFADPHVGLALMQVHPTGPASLWRTIDAGASWHTVPIR